MPATVSAETRRHPSRRVGLQAVGGVPGEGQSAHLASRFGGSAPTRALSARRCPEKSWKNSADCHDCYTASHAKRNVPQEMRKFQNGSRGHPCEKKGDGLMVNTKNFFEIRASQCYQETLTASSWCRARKTEHICICGEMQSAFKSGHNSDVVGH